MARVYDELLSETFDHNDLHICTKPIEFELLLSHVFLESIVVDQLHGQKR